MKPRGSRPHVSLLITDLDNTLYDWFRMWYSSFSAMLDAICATSDIPRAALLAEIRTVHQRRGTSEYSYLLNELPSLTALHPHQDPATVYSDAIYRYRSARKRNLQLYPTVRKSLSYIKECGVPIVVYTESLAFYSSLRLRE